MTLIYLNGVAMPPPTSYDVSLSDIQSSDSGRNDDGVMTIEIIRSDVADIDVGWTNLTQSEMELISSNISMGEITVKFYYGSYKNTIMYKSDRKLKLKCIDDENNCRWDLSFSLVEF